MNYLFNQILIIFIIIFLNFFKIPCDTIKFSVLDMIHTKNFISNQISGKDNNDKHSSNI